MKPEIAVAAMLAAGGAIITAPAAATSVMPITHVIVIMQENRSFDSYFGTYPGANGIPANTCVPVDPTNPASGCIVPFHDVHDLNAGGPHANVVPDIDGGKMDGFIAQQNSSTAAVCSSGAVADHPGGRLLAAGNCAPFLAGIARHDVVGYHTAAELPNYWAYARAFVLQDAMFESAPGYSLPAHLYLTSEWSAACKKSVLSTCVTSMTPAKTTTTPAPYPWVNLFQLMDQHGVSWKYYLDNGAEPDCDDGELTCQPQNLSSGVLSYWNPAPGFTWVQARGAAYIAQHNPPIDQFLLDVRNNTLPQVSWIVPSSHNSEHPTSRVTTGMEYTTSLINAIMQSPYWQNTAIFLAWDDWGGFYDHVQPPRPGSNPYDPGYGFRVPGLTISAYAKPGLVDHQILSFDSYAVFIENVFMGGARLDPVAMNQPDSRPEVRDEKILVTLPNGTTAPIGDLMNDFDFTQTPLPPLVLSTHIPQNITAACGATNPGLPQLCTTPAVTVSWEPLTGSQIPGPFLYHLVRDGTMNVCVTKSVKCVDAAPPSGTHFYTLYSTDSSGAASPQSAATEADVP